MWHSALAQVFVLADDTDLGIVSVRASVVELSRGPLVTGPPKSAAGRRDVSVPEFLLPDVTGAFKFGRSLLRHMGLLR